MIKKAAKGVSQMELFSAFLKSCQQHHHWQPTDRLLLAVSGGVDSMVLVDLIQQLPDPVRPWFGVVHVNHKLRQASEQEELFLRDYCLEKSIPFFQRDWEVAKHPKVGVEAAARTFRYAFFQEMMEIHRATHLVTAHHADDQMETILMRLVRGGQLEGMTGIQHVRSFGPGLLVRPLLDYAKSDLYEYSQAHGVTYFEDETNTSLSYTRNRYRQTVIPLLKKENEQVLAHFKEFSNDLADVLSLANQVVREKSEQLVVKKEPDFLELEIAPFFSFDAETQRQVLNYLLLDLYNNHPMESLRQQVNELISLMTGSKPNGQLDLPDGWKAKRNYHRLRFEKAVLSSVTPALLEQNLFPGQWVALEKGDRIGLFEAATFEQPVLPEDYYIWLDPAEVKLPLTIRHRKPGDRMTLKGMNTGSKKVKSILIDQKVPIEKRNKAYVITDSTNEIIWLVEYKESRLSIERETDKIQYILIYQKEKRTY